MDIYVAGKTPKAQSALKRQAIAADSVKGLIAGKTPKAQSALKLAPPVVSANPIFAGKTPKAQSALKPTSALYSAFTAAGAGKTPKAQSALKLIYNSHHYKSRTYLPARPRKHKVH